MSQEIATLLARNLHDVFGEADADRRRHAVADIFMQDAVFYEPHGIYRGHMEIAEVAGLIRSFHPDYVYTPIRAADILHGRSGRLQWVSGVPGEPPTYAGTDIILVEDGRIRELHLFFDPLPGETGTSPAARSQRRTRRK